MTITPNLRTITRDAGWGADAGWGFHDTSWR